MKNQSCKYDFAGVILKNMIKKFSDNDIDRVMTIWFEVNMDSHGFIIESTETDSDTLQTEYTMLWNIE